MTVSASVDGAGVPDRTDVVAALASAVLLNAALPPSPLPALVFLAPVPFLIRWAHRRATSGALWSATYGALFFGFFWAINLFWVLRLTRIALWPVPAWGGQVMILSLLGALFGLALHGGRNLPLSVTAPVAWVGVEVVRADLLGPLRFPWSPLALALADWPAMLQPAAWVGETGLGIAVMLIAALLAGGLSRTTALLAGGVQESPNSRGSKGAGFGRMLLAAALLGGWFVIGSARLERVVPVPVGEVVLLQPNVPLKAKRDDDRAVASSVAAIEALLPAATRAGAGEIILPETALPMDLDSEEVRALLSTWTALTGRGIWVGGFAAHQDGLLNVLERIPSGRRAAATTWADSTSDGQEADLVLGTRWEKVALVPGIERAWGSEYRAGSPDQPPLDAGVLPPAGVLICIESVHSGLARRHAARGARWLVNVTNDSWLAEESRFSRTRAFAAHPAHMSLRSVETGLGAVRVGNNGWTGTVSPTGVRTEAIPPHIAGVRAVRVVSLEGPTFYVRGGWLLRYLLLPALLLLLIRARTLVVPSEQRFRQSGHTR